MRLKNQGFTLTELLIVIAIAAIMAAIAFPNMNQWIASRRAAGQAEQVSNLLRFARSEAVRLNLPVYVCPVQIKADGNPDKYCETQYAGKGMAAFADKDRNGAYTRGTDVDLRTVILNDTGGDRVDYRFETADFNGKKGDAHTVWLFQSNGTFGHAQKVGAANTFSIGSGFVKIALTDAAAKSDADKKARATILYIDSSGRVQRCDSSATSTVATLCTWG